MERFAERTDRCVDAHQRDNIRLEDRAAVQLVGQGEVFDADAHRMVGIDDPGDVLGVSEPGVGPALAPQLGGSVVIAAAEHLSPGRPPRPAGEGVMQEHDSLAGFEQVVQPLRHSRVRPDRTRCGASLQKEARQVMAQDRVEPAAVLRPEPLLRSRLNSVRERPRSLAADCGQHRVEGVEVDPMPAGHGE